ncbi:triose-phosphate transporter family-domain-containing protein [Pterulicium gracile]|uniref:Triose-phosphate transporter family-domain-containing protein n=1 Tax=Pterulicium gracile TaxID=1884261 RepID=A0A5C3QS63_9AGAR|nr:triose-phosphate transporter family-domain-containing protein [Pterula gracilis]
MYGRLAERDDQIDEEQPLGGTQQQNVHIASTEEKKRLWRKNALINALFIAAWFTFSTIISVYNKWMFSKEHYDFPYPLFVTTVHMFIQFILAALLRFLWPRKFRPKQSPTTRDYATKVTPTAATTSLDIGLSNLSLRAITLSFYTMCKSSSLIFVLLFAFAFRLETFSWRLIGVISIIFVGVILMVATQTQFVLSGFIMVISASALGGLRWSLTNLLMKDKKMGLDSPASTIYWLSPVMGLTLGVISLIVDGWLNVFRTSFFDGVWTSVKTMLFLAAPGAIAFCMVLSEFYIIQRTGVIPMSIAGIFKEVSTISISAWVFGDELTPLNIVGVAITVSGIMLFTYHKYQKSINSTVALDAHGNPVIDDQQDLSHELAEREWLNPGQDDADQGDSNSVVFSADDGEDGVFYGDADATEVGSIRSHKVV